MNTNYVICIWLGNIHCPSDQGTILLQWCERDWPLLWKNLPLLLEVDFYKSILVAQKKNLLKYMSLTLIYLASISVVLVEISISIFSVTWIESQKKNYLKAAIKHSQFWANKYEMWFLVTFDSSPLFGKRFLLLSSLLDLFIQVTFFLHRTRTFLSNFLFILFFQRWSRGDKETRCLPYVSYTQDIFQQRKRKRVNKKENNPIFFLVSSHQTMSIQPDLP